MAWLFLLLFLVVAERVLGAAAKSNADEMFAVAELGIQQLATVRQHDAHTNLLNFPSDLIWYIISMMLEPRIFFQDENQDPKKILKVLICLPDAFARLVNHTEFRTMFPGLEMFELIRLTTVLDADLYLAFEKVKILPKSKLMLDYLSKTTALNYEDDGVTEYYFFSLSRSLCAHNEMELLGHLIESSADVTIYRGWRFYELKERLDKEHLDTNLVATIVYRQDELDFKDDLGASVVSCSSNVSDFCEALVELPAVNLSGSLKLYRLSSDKDREKLFHSILLSGKNRAELDDIVSFMKSLHPSDFVTMALNAMFVAAIDDKYAEYFSKHRKLICKNYLLLLDKLEADATTDEMVQAIVSFIRVIYTIRLGFTDDTSFEADNGRVEIINDEFVEDIVAKLTNSDQIQLASLVFQAVMWAENQVLFSRLLPYMLKADADTQDRIMRHPNAEKLISFAEYRELMRRCGKLKLIHHLKAVRLCKAETSTYYSDELLSMTSPSDRLVLLAAMGNKIEFAGNIQEFGGDHAGLVRLICWCVEDSMPFVKIILENNRNRAKFIYALRSSVFLCALLLGKSRDDCVFEVLSEYKIFPNATFFERFLKDKALQNSFREKSKLLRGIMCIHLDHLEQEAKERIIELLVILQVPLKIDEIAFNVQNVNELRVRFAGLSSEISLAELDLQAQRPGFLAYLAIRYSENTISDFKCAKSVDFADFNLFRFESFDLIWRWWKWNKPSFFRTADWSLVLAFYRAKPDSRTWEEFRKTLCSTETLEHALGTRLSKQRVTFEFRSSNAMQKFEDEVLQEMRYVAGKVRCKANCADAQAKNQNCCVVM